MIKDEDCCLIAHHYETKEMVYFLESVRVFKAAYRPELRDREGDFIKKRVKVAIERPDFVYEDCRKPDSRKSHYCLEYSVNGQNRYVKVVLERVESENCYQVITAFLPDSVKERGKSELIYGTDKK